MTNEREKHNLWDADTEVTDRESWIRDIYMFESPRILGRYKIHREASVNLRAECVRRDRDDSERLKARLATLLIDRSIREDSIPVVNSTMIDDLVSNSQPLSIVKRKQRLLYYIARSNGSLHELLHIWVHEPLFEGALGWSESVTEKELAILLTALTKRELIEEDTPHSGAYRVTVEGFEEVEQSELARNEGATSLARPANGTQPIRTVEHLSDEGNGTNDPKYQVALSFAGEQRSYVEQVAIHLRNHSVKVFYDDFEVSNLWGHSATEVFHKTFAKQSECVVMFISKEYVEKSWPRHERRSALSRMIHEKRPFILPVRFDAVEVPGLPEDLIYRSVDDFSSPAELASEICKNIGIDPLSVKASQMRSPVKESLTGEVVFDYGNYNGCYIIGKGSLAFETKWSRASGTSIHIYDDPQSIHGIALVKECGSISQLPRANTLDFTSRVRTPEIGQLVVLRNIHGFYAAVQVLEIESDRHGSEQDEIRFRYAIQPDGTDNFGEFVSL